MELKEKRKEERNSRKGKDSFLFRLGDVGRSFYTLVPNRSIEEWMALDVSYSKRRMGVTFLDRQWTEYAYIPVTSSNLIQRGRTISVSIVSVWVRNNVKG